MEDALDARVDKRKAEKKTKKTEQQAAEPEAAEPEATEPEAVAMTFEAWMKMPKQLEAPKASRGGGSLG